AMLRNDIGAPDVSYLVVVSGNSAESVLRAAETVDPELDELAARGVIIGFESPARYLPSLHAQEIRLANLPPARQLQTNLKTALQGLPVQPERLTPFLQDVEAARRQTPLTRRDLDGTSLASGVDALLLHDGSRWSALLPLRVDTAVAFDVGPVH